ncbi:hypothetical protein KORDIASMS9_01654 [Kordia sp. SMS9]|uniref:hypothetical protein n=1 Tax=Kordia sp. SMS9 TaxID=2282170 RepID=UPI000E0D7093|nr:hypothetical protein [Kordia sp. SMS9]AXG69432.1 hypothetical protein KORDIASMS9_01654 [Kordia sp. SMS9]
MKKTLLFILLCITCQAFSQHKEKFKSGVKVTTVEKVAEYQKPASLLFVFKGDTHLGAFFLDLENHIKRRFKKELKKGYQLNFMYELTSENPADYEVEIIPKRKFDKANYQSVAYVTISDFKGWDSDLYKKRKQNYNLNIILKGKNSTELLTLVLNVSNYFTIDRKNRNSSKLIYEHLMEK